jgi:uncharacterized membrane protein
MDKRTTGIIATVVTVLFCGCPGLGVCLWGGLTAAGLGTFETTFGTDTTTGQTPTWVGIVGLCAGLLLVLIPVAVGYFTLRNKPEGENVPAE